ncbi:MAG: nucleotidyltransferase domain-containing protein [Gemmatales bacterium]
MQRDRWTEKLARIVADIEAGNTPVPVLQLYVFGSYARGALNPNDLDLVIIHEEPSTELLGAMQQAIKTRTYSYLDSLMGARVRFEARLRQSLRRPGEKMDLLTGTSLYHVLTSHAVPPDELRLLWAADDRDWRTKVDAISLNAHAGTAPRSEFISPKLAQSLPQDVLFITQKLAEQHLILTRIPLDTLEGDEFQPPPGSLPDEYFLSNWGVKAKKCYPYACAWLTSQQSNRILITHQCELFDDLFQYRVQLGKLNLLKMNRLFDRVTLRKQCLIPFFKRGSARELLVFERGPQWKPCLADSEDGLMTERLLTLRPIVELLGGTSDG